MGLVATERIIVQVSPQDKETIIAKAKRLDLSLTELMRRGAAMYETADVEEELGMLADRVIVISERAIASIDDVLAFVVESNNRIGDIDLANNTRRGF